MTEYTETFFRLCGVALLTAIAALTVSELSKTVGIPIRLVGKLLLYGGIFALSASLFSRISAFSSWEAAERFHGLLYRSLGIAMTAEIVADVCRDLHEGSLASLVETAGKLVILAMALPTVEEVLRVVDGLLGSV